MSSRVILVVEDDPTLQLVNRLSLKRLGYDCVTVGTGEAAVEKAGDDILLILMDVGLPGMNGIEAAKRIREKECLEQRQRVPIIGLTGHACREECLEAGMNDFLQKPALMVDLKRMIEQWTKVDAPLTLVIVNA